MQLPFTVLCTCVHLQVDCETYDGLGRPDPAELDATPDFNFEFGNSLGASLGRRRLLLYSAQQEASIDLSSSSSSSRMSSGGMSSRAGRELLQDGGDDGAAIEEVRQWEWPYGYSVGMGNDTAWSTPYISPCRGEQTECGVGANDALVSSWLLKSIAMSSSVISF